MTYFVTTLTMFDPQTATSVTYGKCCQRSLWHQLGI